ncbi:MAG: hypothetical protein Q7J34_05640 [Bacteroidales bacterium]|nr:hypothetical protein [Bacteroidales bacterium]
MKTLKSLLLISFFFLNIQFSVGQNVVELPHKPIDKSYFELKKTLEKIDESNDQKSIDISIKALGKYKDPEIRYHFIYWELSFHYAKLKQYDKCLEILLKGQKEGLFYFIRSSDNTFPEYVTELNKLDGFDEFMKNNTLLKDEASKTTNTEFMIKLPENYNKNNKYPLMLILHGGIGNIPDLQMDYISDKLKNGFILAYFQGASLAGSYTRGFTNGWFGRVKKGYDQIIAKYAVDTTKVIIAGPSAGGARSIILGVNNMIPAKGLLLSFAVTPGGIDSTTYINSAKRGLKIALLCGEKDWAIKEQKELGVNFDKYGFTNRFVVFPEKGHEYPDNWSYHLDTSLEFLLKEE